MRKRIGALFLLLGVTPLFASTDVAKQGFPDAWRCGRGDYSDGCLYVNRSARPVQQVVQARPISARRCEVLVVYGQTFCDDRDRSESSPRMKEVSPPDAVKGLK